MQPVDTVEGLPKVDVNISLAELTFEKKISKGGFGEVWKASYLGTDVAVKRMLRPDDAFVMRLIQRELSALKEIRHPNICLFLGVCMEDSQIYVVTEFIEGGHLWKLLKKKDKALPWHVRLHLAVEIAKAITFLHAKNIMHRDLKSENVLVDKNMNTKVCDFGLSRGVVHEKETKFMTKAGTETWMAPEIIVGSAYSLKADVFSFGVVLYEIIVRDRPPDRSPMDGYQFSEAEFRSEFPPDCPPDLAALAVACVAASPENRPAFKDILTSLKDIQSKVKDDLKNAKLQKGASKLPPPLSPSVEGPAPAALPPASPLISNLMPPPPLASPVVNHPLPPSFPASPLPPTLPIPSPATDSGKLKKKKKKALGEGEAALPPVILPPAPGLPPPPTSLLPPPLEAGQSSLPAPLLPTASPLPPQMNRETDFPPAPSPLPLPPPDFSSALMGNISPTLGDGDRQGDASSPASPRSRTSSRDPSPDPSGPRKRKVVRVSKDKGPRGDDSSTPGLEIASLPPPIISPESSPRRIPPPFPILPTLLEGSIPQPILSHSANILPPAPLEPSTSLSSSAPTHKRKQSKDKADPAAAKHKIK